jgi:hypothetical protein
VINRDVHCGELDGLKVERRRGYREVTFFAPPSTSLPFSFALPHNIHFKVSRIDNGIDIKKPSLIVARRPRAAAVLYTYWYVQK